jgi:hypothetical protein
MRNAFSFKPESKRESKQNIRLNHGAGKEVADLDASDSAFAFTTFKAYVPASAEATAGATNNRQRSTANLFTLLTRHNALPLRLGLMALVFVTALYTKAYTGDYQVIINNHIGGVFYVMFGSLAFSILLPRWKQHHQVLLALSLTSLLELVQWLQVPFILELTRYKVFAYIFGNSYNPHDFIYYGVGAVLGMGVLMLVRE